MNVEVTKQRVCLYCRVSTIGQTNENQIKELVSLCERREFEIVEIYQETVSGSKSNDDRRELTRMINDMRKRKFDKVVVWSIDRLSRNMKELVKTLTLLDDYNCSLFSYQQNLDTSDSISKMFFYFVSIFSEFETNIRKDRQKLGIERVRQIKDFKYGNNSFISDEDKEKILELREKKLTYREIKEQVQVSLGSISLICNST